MTSPATISTASADELRAIVANTGDADLRIRARAELALRAERSRQRVEEHRIQRATVHPISPGHAPEPEREPAPPTREAAWHLISGREDDDE